MFVIYYFNNKIIKLRVFLTTLNIMINKAFYYKAILNKIQKNISNNLFLHIFRYISLFIIYFLINYFEKNN